MTISPDGAGHLFVVSAPSGAGKTTLCRAILKRFSDIRFSISSTTRKPRPNEIDGVDYHFIDKKEFQLKIKQSQWAEWEEIYGNYYGTSSEFVEKCLSTGEDVLFDIDVKGSKQFLKRYPFGITIFIMPPSLDALRQRLGARGTETSEVVERRLSIAEQEINAGKNHRHIIINDEIDRAIAELEAIILGYRNGEFDQK